MKKLSALLCIIWAAVMLTACSAFHDDTTKDYPQDNPLTTTVFLQIKQLPINSTIDAELTQWRSQVLTQNAALTDETATQITDIQFRENTETESTYTVDLTINNVPASTMQKTVRPFKITYTQTIFNPISLFPDSETFTYIVAYSAERRHSTTNADDATTMNNNYVYFWTTNNTIEFVDVYPNRPLYYLIILGGAFVVGGFILIVSRDYDCKKRKNQL